MSVREAEKVKYKNKCNLADHENEIQHHKE